MKWPMMTMCNKAKVWLSVETRARVKGGQRPLAIFLHCPASQCCTAGLQRPEDVSTQHVRGEWLLSH